MRPDLRNVVIEVEDKRNSQRRVVAHHRAFPELKAEGQAPTEGLLALLGLLKRSSPPAMDDRHCLELRECRLRRRIASQSHGLVGSIEDLRLWLCHNENE